ATKPQAKWGATLGAAVLFGPGGVARSLQIRWRDMLVARALPGPQTSRRKRHRIYAHDHSAHAFRRADSAGFPAARWPYGQDAPAPAGCNSRFPGLSWGGLT